MKKFIFLLIMILLILNFSIAKDGKTSIKYIGNAQVEIESPEGVRIFIDVYYPDVLPKNITENDILLTTHSHSDHYIKSFVEKFPGKKICIKTGYIEEKDVKITGIPSSHSSITDFVEENGSNYIFIIDIGDFRIVHFGDIGQETLSSEQLEKIGNVDIAITQFENMYSGMNMNNLKGFNLMDQVKPKCIIPTHYSEASFEYSLKKWKVMYYDEVPVKIGKDNLKNETVFLVLGDFARLYKKKYKLPKMKI